MAQNTQIAEVKKQWVDSIATDLESVRGALPTNFNRSRFIENAVAVIMDKGKELEKYGSTQVMNCLRRGAILGLDFMNKECYMVGYGNKLEFQMDYSGMEKLVKKYSIRPVREIIADVVREGDDFSACIKDSVPQINFVPKMFNTAEIVGAFAYVVFEDGGISYCTMSRKELDTVRSKSKMGNGGAWKDFPERMYRKVAIRRLLKDVEVDFENAFQVEYYNDDEAIPQTSEEIIDSVAVEIEENANQIPFDAES